MAEVAVDHGRIARGWMMPFNGMVQKGMVEMGRGGACVPARVALQGRIHRSSPRIKCVFLAWKRRCADVRAGTPAPPLRILLERFVRGRPPSAVSFGQIARGRLAPFGWIARECRMAFDGLCMMLGPVV